jgi:glucose/arabinose dehydrogenase
VESSAALLEGELGRVRDVAQSPDGWLYLCTSNRDGRGNPVPGDDLIARALELPA